MITCRFLSIFFIFNVQGRLRSTSERAVRPTPAQQAVLPYSHGLLQEQVSHFPSMWAVKFTNCLKTEFRRVKKTIRILDRNTCIWPRKSTGCKQWEIHEIDPLCSVHVRVAYKLYIWGNWGISLPVSQDLSFFSRRGPLTDVIVGFSGKNTGDEMQPLRMRRCFNSVCMRSGLQCESDVF